MASQRGPSTNASSRNLSRRTQARSSFDIVMLHPAPSILLCFLVVLVTTLVFLPCNVMSWNSDKDSIAPLGTHVGMFGWNNPRRPSYLTETQPTHIPGSEYQSLEEDDEEDEEELLEGLAHPRRRVTLQQRLSELRNQNSEPLLHPLSLSSSLGRNSRPLQLAISTPPLPTNDDDDDLHDHSLSSWNSVRAQSYSVRTQPHPYSTHSERAPYLSTGTTIAGLVCPKYGVVILGADTRATSGRLVADRRADKIHKLAHNVYACGAGTSADLDYVTRFTQHSFRYQYNQQQVGNAPTDVISLHNTDIQVSIHEMCRFLQDYLYDQNGSCQANLIVGGVWQKQPVLRAIHPHGSMDAVSFAALGSGGLAAMSILESRYTPKLTVEEGIELIKQAIVAGIENDLGSGSQVDVCIIDQNGNSKHIRAAVPEETLPVRPPTTHTKADDSSEDGTWSTSTMPTVLGVNGFGNLPFAIQSSRQICRYPDDATNQEWNDLLGL